MHEYCVSQGGSCDYGSTWIWDIWGHFDVLLPAFLWAGSMSSVALSHWHILFPSCCSPWGTLLLWLPGFCTEILSSSAVCSVPCTDIRVMLLDFLGSRGWMRGRFSGLFCFNVPEQRLIVQHLWNVWVYFGCFSGLGAFYVASPLFFFFFGSLWSVLFLLFIFVYCFFLCEELQAIQKVYPRPSG